MTKTWAYVQWELANKETSKLEGSLSYYRLMAYNWVPIISGVMIGCKFS